MHPTFPHEMTIACRVTPLRITTEGLEPPQCQACRIDLNLHQPDEVRPEHMLGTCARCGEWYLIEFGKDLREAFLFDLANVKSIRATLAAVKQTRRRGSPKEARGPD